jgi:polysaccharide export outer membrane protein
MSNLRVRAWLPRLLPVFLVVLVVLAAAAEQLKKPEGAPAPGESEYRLGPSDLLEVFVWKEPELSTTVPVRPDGNISLPLAGELRASGKTTAQLKDEITASLRQFITNPVVTVVVKEVNSSRVAVLGQVRKPDSYRVNHRVTIIEAIAMAGGFTDFAKRSRIIVLRNGSSGPHWFKLDFTRLIKNNGGEVFYLQPSDTVYVE